MEQTLSRGAIEHELKTDHEPYEEVLANRKTHEIRYNDRDFRVGDRVRLRETKYSSAEIRDGMPLIYTGRETTRRITHVLSGYGLQTGWVALSLTRGCEQRPSTTFTTLNGESIQEPESSSQDIATAALGSPIDSLPAQIGYDGPMTPSAV